MTDENDDEQTVYPDDLERWPRRYYALADQPESDEEIHPLKQRIQDLEYAGDTESLQKLRQEGQRTLEQQLDALDDIDTKAMSILRVNILLVGLILSAFSVAVNYNGSFPMGNFQNLYIGSGIVALLLSTALAAFTYTASDSQVGMGYQTIHQAIDADLTEQEFEIGAANSYAHWIEFNDKTNIRNAPFITLTSLLVVLGIVNLSLGVYEALIAEYTLPIALVSWAVFLAVTLATGLVGQLETLRDEVSVRDWWNDLLK